LDAGAAEEELGRVGVVDGVGVVAFDPLAAGGVFGAAEGAGGGVSAGFEEEVVGELGVFFEFAAALGGEDFVGEVVAFEPVVEGADFLFIAEADPGFVGGIEEESHVFEAFLDEGVGPGGELDGFAGGHGEEEIPLGWGESNFHRTGRRGFPQIGTNVHKCEDHGGKFLELPDRNRGVLK
jgi:hypothetical protein